MKPSATQSDQLGIAEVLHALADPTRLRIVAVLAADGERPCGTFEVGVSASTLSHHFRVLRQAGVVYQRAEGRRRVTGLRRDDLDRRFPGLLDVVLAGAPSGEPPSSP